MAGFTAPSMAHMTVLLALAMAVLVTPPAAAQLLVSSSDLHLAATRTSPGIVEQTLSSLSLLSPSSLQLSQPLVPVLAIPQCGMMSQIQIGDTCASITYVRTEYLAFSLSLACTWRLMLKVEQGRGPPKVSTGEKGKCEGRNA